MKTRALRVTVGCYETGEWHVSIIRDVYERGVSCDSELIVGPIYCSRARVETVVTQQLRSLMRWEETRRDRAAAPDQSQDRAAAAVG